MKPSAPGVEVYLDALKEPRRSRPQSMKWQTFFLLPRLNPQLGPGYPMASMVLAASGVSDATRVLVGTTSLIRAASARHHDV